MFKQKNLLDTNIFTLFFLLLVLNLNFKGIWLAVPIVLEGIANVALCSPKKTFYVNIIQAGITIVVIT